MYLNDRIFLIFIKTSLLVVNTDFFYIYIRMSSGT